MVAGYSRAEVQIIEKWFELWSRAALLSQAICKCYQAAYHKLPRQSKQLYSITWNHQDQTNAATNKRMAQVMELCTPVLGLSKLKSDLQKLQTEINWLQPFSNVEQEVKVGANFLSSTKLKFITVPFKPSTGAPY